MTQPHDPAANRPGAPDAGPYRPTSGFPADPAAMPPGEYSPAQESMPGYSAPQGSTPGYSAPQQSTPGYAGQGSTPGYPAQDSTPAYPGQESTPGSAAPQGSMPGSADEAGTSATAGRADPRPLPGMDSKGRVRSSRISGVWIGLIVAAVCLLLLVIFIAQNSKTASIHFLGFNGHMSLALIILLAAVIGLLIAAVPGSIRIIQLRKALKQKATTTVNEPSPK